MAYVQNLVEDFALLYFLNYIKKKLIPQPTLEPVLKLKNYDQYIKTNTIYKIKNVKKLIKIIEKFYNQNGHIPNYYYTPYKTFNNPKLSNKIKKLFWTKNSNTYYSIYDLILNKLYNSNYFTDNLISSCLNFFGYKFAIFTQSNNSFSYIGKQQYRLDKQECHEQDHEDHKDHESKNKLANKNDKAIHIVFKKTGILGGNKIYPIISDKDSLNKLLNIRTKVKLIIYKIVIIYILRHTLKDISDFTYEYF